MISGALKDSQLSRRANHLLPHEGKYLNYGDSNSISSYGSGAASFSEAAGERPESNYENVYTSLNQGGPYSSRNGNSIVQQHQLDNIARAQALDARQAQIRDFQMDQNYRDQQFQYQQQQQQYEQDYQYYQNGPEEAREDHSNFQNPESTKFRNQNPYGNQYASYSALSDQESLYTPSPNHHYQQNRSDYFAHPQPTFVPTFVPDHSPPPQTEVNYYAFQHALEERNSREETERARNRAYHQEQDLLLRSNDELSFYHLESNGYRDSPPATITYSDPPKRKSGIEESVPKKRKVSNPKAVVTPIIIEKPAIVKKHIQKPKPPVKRKSLPRSATVPPDLVEQERASRGRSRNVSAPIVVPIVAFVGPRKTSALKNSSSPAKVTPVEPPFAIITEIEITCPSPPPSPSPPPVPLESRPRPVYVAPSPHPNPEHSEAGEEDYDPFLSDEESEAEEAEFLMRARYVPLPSTTSKNIKVRAPRMATSKDSPEAQTYGKNVKPFIAKLTYLMNTPAEYGKVIRWNKNGTILIININENRLATEILPRFFSHKSVSAFQRQLNVYQFIRIPIENLEVIIKNSDKFKLDPKFYIGYIHSPTTKPDLIYSKSTPNEKLELFLPAPSKARQAATDARNGIENPYKRRKPAKKPATPSVGSASPDYPSTRESSPLTEVEDLEEELRSKKEESTTLADSEY